MGQSTQAQQCTGHRSDQLSRSGDQVRARMGRNGTDHPSFRGIRTLIVEDSEIDRKVALGTATRLGLRAEAVDSGELAIQLLKQADQEDPFDLVLIDFRMPNLDGLTTSNYIKQELGLANRPAIILLSAYRKDDIFGRHRQYVFVEGFLTKPLSNRLLAEMIADLQDSAGFKGQNWPPCRDDRLFTRAHVLLAEDNLINQKVAAGMLTRKGAEVTVVHHGQEAINTVLNNHPNTFQIILMDLDMPVVDGYQAARQIKSHHDYAHIPIIALTAHNSPEGRDRCLAAGMSAHLSKPVKPDLFYDTLLTFLRYPDA